MKKPLFAVDLDDTLFDENNAIRLFINDNYGFAHTEKDYLKEGSFGNYWESIWRVDNDTANQMFRHYVKSQKNIELKPIEFAIETLNELNKYYNLVIITAREHRLVTTTHASLTKHYPNIFSDVHFMKIWEDDKKITKGEICIETGASYLIDDSFENCKLAALAGVKTILFGDYGWNRNRILTDGIIHCPDWKSVFNTLVK
jgi:FMN phosphatase YigB (HAD superfamily)